MSRAFRRSAAVEQIDLNSRLVESRAFALEKKARAALLTTRADFAQYAESGLQSLWEPWMTEMESRDECRRGVNHRGVTKLCVWKLCLRKAAKRFQIAVVCFLSGSMLALRTQAAVTSFLNTGFECH